MKVGHDINSAFPTPLELLKQYGGRNVDESQDAVREAINQFCCHFLSQLSEIEKIENLLFQKILIVTLLAALSVGRYPAEKSDRSKFIKLIFDHANWRDARCVSFTQLQLRLEKLKESLGERSVSTTFAAKLNELHFEWQQSLSSRIFRGSRLDPCLEDLLPATSSDHERKLLNSCTHASLLYLQRNKLVHEFREPGYQSQIGQDDGQPYYVPTTDLESNKEIYELTYPRNFMLRIARSVISDLERYYSEEKINPYLNYEFGSVWD